MTRYKDSLIQNFVWLLAKDSLTSTFIARIEEHLDDILLTGAEKNEGCTIETTASPEKEPRIDLILCRALGEMTKWTLWTT